MENDQLSTFIFGKAQDKEAINCFLWHTFGL